MEWPHVLNIDSLFAKLQNRNKILKTHEIWHEKVVIAPKREQIAASVLFQWKSVWKGKDKMVNIINSDQIQDHLALSVIFLLGAFGGKVINILLSSATNFGSTASILTSTNAHTIY